MKVAVVIPTLDEQDGIGPTIAAIDQDAFARRGWGLEVIVVDGQSRDRTREIAVEHGARVLVEPRRGYGRAYKTGFGSTDADVVVTGDADGTYPFERIHEYVGLLVDEDLAFVTCDRYAELERGAMSATHRFGNWVLSSTARLLFWQSVRDSQSGMWIVSREALEAVGYEMLSDGMAFSQEIKIEAFRRFGARAREIPAGLRRRIGVPVIASWRDGLGNLRGLVRHRVRRT